MLDPVYQALLDGLHNGIDGVDEGSAEEAGLSSPVPKMTVKANADKLAKAAAESQAAYIKEGLTMFVELAKVASSVAKA